MTTDEYVPSDDDVRIEYVLAHQGLEAQLDAGEAYDRWLAARDAHVHRDASREALDAYIAYETDGDVADDIETFRDRNYPEETT